MRIELGRGTANITVVAVLKDGLLNPKHYPGAIYVNKISPTSTTGKKYIGKNLISHG